MSPRVSAPTSRRQAGAQDLTAPPRAMAKSAQRGNRRRAWPRWTRPALKAAVLALPAVALGLGAVVAWRDGALSGLVGRTESGLVDTSAGWGLRLVDIAVEGRSETDHATLLATMGLRPGTPMLAIDLSETKARLESLPWVSGASVERRLPDTLFVRLNERQPMAIWQHDRQFIVIDREGRPLADAGDLAKRGNLRIDDLPQVVGTNAPLQVQKLLIALDLVQPIRDRLAAANWISDRRWDLTLRNGIIVRLPETGMATALKQLAEMDASSRVLDRDIVAVDLRLPDKMVVQTSQLLPGMEDEKKKPGKKS